MRRRKTWIAVTCMLSLALAGSLFGNHAFAADGNGIGEHIGHSAAETTSIEEEFTDEEFTNAGNVATLPVPNAEENSNTGRGKFIFADKKSAENEKVVCYLSTNPLYENLEKIQNGGVAFCINGGEIIDGIPVYTWLNQVDSEESYFFLDDSSEIKDGDNIYISLGNEDETFLKEFFKEDEIFTFNDIENKDVVTSDEVSLILSEDDKLKIDTSVAPGSNVLTLTMEEFDSLKNDPSNYGIGKCKDGTISFVKKIYSAQRTIHDQYVIKKIGKDFQFCGRMDIYALQKDVFGFDENLNFEDIIQVAKESGEDDDFGLVLDTAEQPLLVYRGGELEASTENTTQTSITEEQSSDTVTETVLEANQEEASSAITSQTDSEEEQETVSNESKKYKWISIGLLCAFVLIGAGWILVPPLLKKNKKK